MLTFTYAWDVMQIGPYNKSLIESNENGINMNILVDRSIIESFGNHEIVITSMINPSNITLADQRKVIFHGNEGLSCEVQAWNLQL